MEDDYCGPDFTVLADAARIRDLPAPSPYNLQTEEAKTESLPVPQLPQPGNSERLSQSFSPASAVPQRQFKCKKCNSSKPISEKENSVKCRVGHLFCKACAQRTPRQCPVC